MQSVYGLIGYPLLHSFSPGYFKEKFAKAEIDAVYRLFPLANIKKLPQLLAKYPSLSGLNVTIPYKEQVIPFLDDIDNAAKAIGAVNCIKISNGKLKGYNTDVIGFEHSLVPLLQPQHTKALVLGTGGAAKAVAYVLGKLNINYQLVSSSDKTGTIAYRDISTDTIEEHKLIINTTPLGMHPNTDACPDIPYSALGETHLLYDLIYNPEETTFLKKGNAQGATTKNGYEMLVLQAEASWDIWNN